MTFEQSCLLPGNFTASILLWVVSSRPSLIRRCKAYKKQWHAWHKASGRVSPEQSARILNQSCVFDWSRIHKATSDPMPKDRALRMFGSACSTLILLGGSSCCVLCLACASSTASLFAWPPDMDRDMYGQSRTSRDLAGIEPDGCARKVAMLAHCNSCTTQAEKLKASQPDNPITLSLARSLSLSLSHFRSLVLQTSSADTTGKLANERPASAESAACSSIAGTGLGIRSWLA